MAGSRRKWVKPAIYAGLAVLIGIAGVETLHWWRHVDEPNARVEADFTLLSSSVNATIGEVHVRRGDRVAKGALLASMVTAVAGLDVATLEAEAAKERAARDLVEAELAEYIRETHDKIATAKAEISLQRREHTAWERRHTSPRAMWIGRSNWPPVEPYRNGSLMSPRIACLTSPRKCIPWKRRSRPS